MKRRAPVSFKTSPRKRTNIEKLSFCKRHALDDAPGHTDKKPKLSWGRRKTPITQATAAGIRLHKSNRHPSRSVRIVVNGDTLTRCVVDEARHPIRKGASEASSTVDATQEPQNVNAPDDIKCPDQLDTIHCPTSVGEPEARYAADDSESDNTAKDVAPDRDVAATNEVEEPKETKTGGERSAPIDDSAQSTSQAATAAISRQLTDNQTPAITESPGPVETAGQATAAPLVSENRSTAEAQNPSIVSNISQLLTESLLSTAAEHESAELEAADEQGSSSGISPNMIEYLMNTMMSATVKALIDRLPTEPHEDPNAPAGGESGHDAGEESDKRAKKSQTKRRTRVSQAVQDLMIRNSGVHAEKEQTDANLEKLKVQAEKEHFAKMEEEKRVAERRTADLQYVIRSSEAVADETDIALRKARRVLELVRRPKQQLARNEVIRSSQHEMFSGPLEKAFVSVPSRRSSQKIAAVVRDKKSNIYTRPLTAFFPKVGIESKALSTSSVVNDRAQLHVVESFVRGPFRCQTQRVLWSAPDKPTDAGSLRDHIDVECAKDQSGALVLYVDLKAKYQVSIVNRLDLSFLDVIIPVTIWMQADEAKCLVAQRSPAHQRSVGSGQLQRHDRDHIMAPVPFVNIRARVTERSEGLPITGVINSEGCAARLESGTGKFGLAIAVAEARPNEASCSVESEKGAEKVRSDIESSMLKCSAADLGPKNRDASVGLLYEGTSLRKQVLLRQTFAESEVSRPARSCKDVAAPVENHLSQRRDLERKAKMSFEQDMKLILSKMRNKVTAIEEHTLRSSTVVAGTGNAMHQAVTDASHVTAVSPTRSTKSSRDPVTSALSKADNTIKVPQSPPGVGYLKRSSDRAERLLSDMEENNASIKRQVAAFRARLTERRLIPTLKDELDLIELPKHDSKRS